MGRAWVSWSSGKDCAMALAAARQAGTDVVALLVTFDEDADRVAMHAVRRQLVEAQADRLGLPVVPVGLPRPCPDDEYALRMAAALDRARADGVEEIIFGDLFLEDVRAYRERAMAGTGLVPRFPLWGRPTDELAHQVVDGGIDAVVTCVDPRQLDASFAGRRFDAELLAQLPAGVDPCGERGELHTFVCDGPGFSSPVDVSVGPIVERDGFVFADLVPAERAAMSSSGGR